MTARQHQIEGIEAYGHPSRAIRAYTAPMPTNEIISVRRMPYAKKKSTGDGWVTGWWDRWVQRTTVEQQIIIAYRY